MHRSLPIVLYPSAELVLMLNYHQVNLILQYTQYTVSWVSHRYYDGAQHSQFGLGVDKNFSHCILDFSISKQVAAGQDCRILQISMAA